VTGRLDDLLILSKLPERIVEVLTTEPLSQLGGKPDLTARYLELIGKLPEQEELGYCLQAFGEQLDTALENLGHEDLMEEFPGQIGHVLAPCSALQGAD
jgi:hypothetical protein